MGYPNPHPRSWRWYRAEDSKKLNENGFIGWVLFQYYLLNNCCMSHSWGEVQSPLKKHSKTSSLVVPRVVVWSFSREHSELDFWWQVSTHKNDQKEIAKILSTTKTSPEILPVQSEAVIYCIFPKAGKRQNSFCSLLPTRHATVSHSVPHVGPAYILRIVQNTSVSSKNQASLPICIGRSTETAYFNPSQNSGPLRNPSQMIKWLA